MSKRSSTLRNRIVGLLMQHARAQAAKTRGDLASALATSSDTVAAFETGRIPISLPELEIVAAVLNTSVAYFWHAAPHATPGPVQLPRAATLPVRHRIVGALLRRARLDGERSLQDLATTVHCSARRISEYELGTTPIPLPDLQAFADSLGLGLDYFLDAQDGSVGDWQQAQSNWLNFKSLPRDIQEFVTKPINVKYLEIATRLSALPAEDLRAIAEGLLEITY
jgi:transcriptional regulator with XRE-family HTH domain